MCEFDLLAICCIYDNQLTTEMLMATSIKIDDDLKSRLAQLANAQQKSPDWMMREAIAQYVDREEARASFLQEALDSWAEFQQTGRHLTGDETRRWIESWGTEHEMAMPECHN